MYETANSGLAIDFLRSLLRYKMLQEFEDSLQYLYFDSTDLILAGSLT